jgi:hypothetical protein
MPYQSRHSIDLLVESEVAGIEQMDLGIGDVAPIGQGTVDRRSRII